MSIINNTIAFIGGGRITEILIDNLVHSNTVMPDYLIVSDPDQKRLEFLAESFSVKTTTDNLMAADAGDLVFINVRPQVVGDILEEFTVAQLLEGKILLTLAAGIPMEAYKGLGENLAIVRALPNPPSQIGRGVVAIVFNEFRS